MDLIQALAAELGKDPRHVENVVHLLDEGNTIPFIARYRKELHGAMDDTSLRTLEERLQYLRGLEERREAVKKSIEEQGKLTEESRQELAQTMDRSVERMAAAFELLECGVWQPVIESVVYAGLYQVGNAVLNGTFHQRPRREKYPERKAGHGDA